jgi:hypothetical protein
VAQGKGPEFKPQYQKKKSPRCQGLTPVILAIRETEIRRIAIRGQSGLVRSYPKNIQYGGVCGLNNVYTCE